MRRRLGGRSPSSSRPAPRWSLRRSPRRRWPRGSAAARSCPMRSNGHHRGLLAGVYGRFTRDIGIDLGTANTLVHVGGRGVVLREPSVVAINKDDGKVIWVGEEAKRMLGRTPANIVATRPLRHGVIADYEQTEKMLHYFIAKVCNKFLLRKTVVVGIPSGATEVERRAVIEASRQAGATHAY